MHMQAGERVTCESSGNQPHKKEDLVYAHALSIMGGVCTVHVCKHIYIVSGERERQREGVAILVQAASGLRTVGPLSSFLSLLQGPRRSKSLPVCHFLPSLLKQLLSGETEIRELLDLRAFAGEVGVQRRTFEAIGGTTGLLPRGSDPPLPQRYLHRGLQ